MSKECVEQVEGTGASVPMTDISNIDVPEGTDELSRSTRRAWRDRLNDASSRKMALGVLATLVGGSFWGFSGTSASFLFDTYHVDTLWLMSVRQILAGLLFMVVVVARDRARLVKLWTTPVDRKQLLLFTAFGLLFNQFCYLSAVRLTNAGTATVLQCLQLVIIMGYTCITDRRKPRMREVIGIGLALGGTFLIATGGDPNEVIPVFIDIDYELKYTSVERISFVVTKTETLANAYSEQYFYNLALPDGRDLQLSDLLGPDFKRIVDAEVERQIAERGKDPDIVFFEGENGFRGIDDRQKFFIDADGQVVVVFAKYEIAPGSMGIQTFKIPAPLPGNSSGR